MPNILYGDGPKIDYTALESKDYNYDYPDNLDLRPTSDLHKVLRDAIWKRAHISSEVMSTRFTSWNDIDKKLTGYMSTTTKEREIKSGDSRKPISIVFPYSYVVMETTLAYLVSAFLPEPIFRYEGVSPEDMVGAIMLESVINSHCNRRKVGLNLHTHFRDISSYGVGVCVPTWDIINGKKIVKKANGFFDFLSRFISTGYSKEMVDSTLFEGNGLINIDPYCYLPDPNVPVHSPQSGEFVGWIEHSNLMNLLTDETTDNSLFNIKYLKHVRNKQTSIYPNDQSMRTLKAGSSTLPRDDSVLNPLDIIWMYIKLIPKDWKLSSKEDPEIWMFGLASDAIIISARPLGLAHNMFPVAVSAPDFDGYSPVAYSRLEIEYGLQEILDWLLNSHITNVRKAINDMLIVDPYLINVNDLKSPGPGKLIRTRRPAWGRGVENVVQQLKVEDITRNNIADASFIMQMMDSVGATNNPMQGTLRQGGPERLTKTEFSGTMAGALSRMERIARVIGLQSMQDIGYMFAYHAQQFMSEETYVKVIGTKQEMMQRIYNATNKSIKVTPFDILVDYDVMIRDGSVPGGNYNEVWAQLFQTIVSQPYLVQKFDVVRIFKHIARGMGAKDVEQFEIVNPQLALSPKINASALPDEAVNEQVQAGNLIPMRGNA